MPRLRATVPALLLPALLAACATPAPAPGGDAAAFDLAAARQEITALNARFTQAHVDRDSLTIDSMLTADARSLPPGAEPAIGLAAIHALTMEYLKAGVTEFREETTDFYGDAEMLVDQGTYVLTYGSPAVTERGKYLNVWVRDGGRWKIRTNIWNSSTP